MSDKREERELSGQKVVVHKVSLEIFPRPSLSLPLSVCCTLLLLPTTSPNGMLNELSSFSTNYSREIFLIYDACLSRRGLKARRTSTPELR